MRLIATTEGFGRTEDRAFVPMWRSAADFYAGRIPQDSPGSSLDNVNNIAPPPQPSKVVCVGLNYRDQAEEAGQPIPQVPILFPTFANSICGPGKVRIPAAVQSCDYEAELAVVIDQRASRVAAADSLGTLEPGDVIITGSPFGVGLGFDPPRYLSAGEVVTVAISGLGSLVTTFVQE